MRLDPVLLEILVCPDCKGTLEVDDEHDELVCTQCGLAYPVRDDIPVMLVDEARRPQPADAAATDAPSGDGDDDAGPDSDEDAVADSDD